MKCFIDGISYSLGKKGVLSDLPVLQNDEGLLEVLKLKGLGAYRYNSGEYKFLILDSIKRTLKECKVTPEEIDGIVFISDSYQYMESFSRIGVNEIINELGLVNAYPYGVSLSECANLASGIEMARSLVLSGSKKKVLLIIADHIHPEKSDDRLLDLGMAVFSDGVASCLIHSSEEGAYEIVDVVQHMDPEIDKLDVNTDIQLFYTKTADGLKTVATRLLERNNITNRNIKKLFTNNYIIHTQKMFAKQAGFDKDQCYFDNVARIGHVFAADGLINLKDFTISNEISEEKPKYLLLGTSPSSWGAILIEQQF